MITSQLTAKSQTTIPRAVRSELGLKPGDAIAYELSDGRAVLTKAPKAPDMFVANFSTFTEWASEADEAYNVLASR